MEIEYQDIDVHYEDRVAYIILNRPEKRNALSLTMINEIESAIKLCNEKNGIKLIVIKSNIIDPPVFSAGIDLMDLASQVQARFESGLQELIDTMQDRFETIRSCKLPTIAVIDGLCVGAGLELAIACDFRLTTSRSELALNEVQFGLVPDLGGTTHLIRLIGLQAAKRIIMLGQKLSAEDAYRMGLIDWISDSLSSTLQEIINQVSINSENAVIQAKRILNSSLDYDISESMKRDGIAQKKLLESGEPQKRLEQFLKHNK